MYIDIGINLTNKQFAGEYDEVIDRGNKCWGRADTTHGYKCAK